MSKAPTPGTPRGADEQGVIIAPGPKPAGDPPLPGPHDPMPPNDLPGPKATPDIIAPPPPKDGVKT